MYQRQFKKYNTLENASSSKLIQVAILLENCAQLLQKTIVALETKQYEERFLYIDKTIIILGAIQDVLATDRSGMARDLNTYFQNTIQLLTQVSIQEDIDLCKMVRERLIEMAQIWRDADKTLNVDKPSGQQSEQEAIKFCV